MHVPLSAAIRCHENGCMRDFERDPSGDIFPWALAVREKVAASLASTRKLRVHHRFGGASSSADPGVGRIENSIASTTRPIH